MKSVNCDEQVVSSHRIPEGSPVDAEGQPHTEQDAVRRCSRFKWKFQSESSEQSKAPWRDRQRDGANLGAANTGFQ